MLRKWIIGVFSLITAALPMVQGQPSDNRIVYGLTFQPSGFDPHINASAELGIPLRQVYDTLVYRDPQTAEIVPGLATEWTISEDGLAYTFKLRTGVTFHDGTPFNAQSVAVNLDRITNSANASQRAVFMLGPYAGYEIIDDTTIVIRLNEPYSPLLDSFAQVYLGIASPTALAENSVNRYQFHQVGTGPFIWVEYVPGDRIVLRRNPDYAWGPAFYQPTTNGLEEIEFRFFEDPVTRSLALESDQAQVMGELLPTDARLLIGNSAVQLLQADVPGLSLQFQMNTLRFPTDTRAVRQAILFGTNRDAIIDAVYQRFSPVAWGPLAANTLYYNREMTGLYAYNLTQSQALLAEAGYSDSNADGILDVAGVDVQVDVIVPPWGLLPQVAELLQDQWRTLGIRTVLHPVPTRTALLEAVSNGEYNLVAYDTAGIDPAIVGQFYSSNGSNNFMGYSNPDLDRLVTEGTRQNDPATRAAIYGEIQRVIMDEALILPIRDYVNLNGMSTALQGLMYDPYGWFPLLNNVTFAPVS